jgi:sporulation protein YlmC with PRC-barrel domain
MKTVDLEKENQTGKNHDRPDANTPVRLLTATSIIGDEVINHADEHLGKIKDIMIDVRRGTIEYVVIEFGGFLGIGEKFFAVPFEALQLKAGRQVYVLHKDKHFLKDAPGFDKDHWPGTNSRHYSEVRGYWGDFMGPSTGGI